MTIEKVKKYKRGLGSFIRSEKGQRFFNFAYSIGAAVVIWGALFKILNIHGGNVLLSVGMGTEVLMFILTAFDRPPKEYRWEDVFPALKGTPEGAGEAPEEVAEALQGSPDLRTGADRFCVGGRGRHQGLYRPAGFRRCRYGPASCCHVDSCTGF